MAKESSLARLPFLAKLGIGTGLLVLVGVAYFVVFYGDLASSIKAAQGRERQLRSDLAEARKNEFAYQKDLAELTDRQQRQRELQKILPATTEYPSFLSSLQSVANVSGVTLSAWTPQEEIPEQFYARVPMKLELTGRFHQVAKFFYGVGQLDRIINMENISVTDPKQEGDEVDVKVEVLATAFRALAEGQGKVDKREQRQQQGGPKK
ncbi:MAG: type 4a pilus biogenesis protein PilO [Myxococcales bacterium]|nr:type 4a pilus biogenesis protein PilO [Myxococcales bacterium]MCB9579453.1 type 4a pilus biogenesis protein PilO [Polyangiaceae bacterium]